MKPTFATLCLVCKHALGLHFLSYDGKIDGCGHVRPGGGDVRESWPEQRCACKGFAYAYRPTTDVASGAESWYNK